MIKAPEVNACLAAQPMRFQSRLSLSNTPSKDCFAAVFILNPVKGAIKFFLFLEGRVGKQAFLLHSNGKVGNPDPNKADLFLEPQPLSTV